MKKLLTILFVVTLIASATASAGWQFVSAFPDTNFRGLSGEHGIAVDPAGKIWVTHYAMSSTRTQAQDSIFNGTTWVGVKPIFVFNPDGTPASFSPIKVVVGPSWRDTLFASNSNRGLRRDVSGNILASVFGNLYRINYQTGAGMNRVTVDAVNSIGAACVDTLGEIFVATVAPGNPIKIYNSAFSYLGNVTDTSVGFHRSFEVSKDGNNVYWAGYTNHAIRRYHSDFGSFGPYTVGPTDTLLKGFDCESMTWNPTRTRLWASAGSAADAPNRYPGAVTNYSVNTWYAWNPTTNTITDSLKWDFRFSRDSANVKPRGIAFSNDGLTAYVIAFGASYANTLKYTFVPSSVEQDLSVIPVAFTLSQNYPNPFNPSTEIKFTLTKGGFTTLKVYNALGQEVASLVSENLNVGGYTSHFDATNLASGTYIYRLTTDGQTMSKKMVLMK